MAGYYPDQAGPQMPQKYPRVGKNYRQWGEIPGFIYDYSIDMYRRDPKVDQEIGLAEKPKSMTDQLLPIASVAGGAALATEAGKQAIPTIKGLLGAGETAKKTQEIVEGVNTAAEAAEAAQTAETGSEVVSFGSEIGGAPEVFGPEFYGPEMGPTPGYVYAAPVVATALGARYGLRALQGKTKNWKDASLADNAGRAITAMATFGGSELANYLGNRFGGDKNRWQTEKKRLEKLREQGYTDLPDYSGLKGGRSKEELVQLAKDTGGNVKFAESRNEADLTPQDIAGYASIIEKAGPGASLDQRLDLATKALAAGAVREHHGTIDVDWSKVDAAQPPPAPAAAPAAPAPAVSQQSGNNGLLARLGPGDVRNLPQELTPEEIARISEIGLPPGHPGNRVGNGLLGLQGLYK